MKVAWIEYVRARTFSFLWLESMLTYKVLQLNNLPGSVKTDTMSLAFTEYGLPSRYSHMHFISSVIAGNNFLKVVSVLVSHCSEHLQVIQSGRDPFKMILSLGNRGLNLVNVVDIPTAGICFSATFHLKKAVCRKAHWHDANSTCSAKDLILF
jgi:hypothetical protein